MLKLMHKKLSTFSSSKYLFIKTYAAMRLLLVSSADDPCKQFGPRSGPQTFWHSDGIPEIFFFKMLALKKEKKQQTTNVHNFPACRVTECFVFVSATCGPTDAFLPDTCVACGTRFYTCTGAGAGTESMCAGGLVWSQNLMSCVPSNICIF